MMEFSRSQRRQLAEIEAGMVQADSYAQWLALAGEHDQRTGASQWKAEEDNSLFDAVDIRRRHEALSRQIRARASEDLLFTLNEGIHGNMSGMANPALYEVAKSGTKTLINDYVADIVDALHVVAEAPESEISFAEKLDCFHRVALCYGRSALLMSGGGGLVYFHHGVISSLLEEGLLPPVLAGSSAGAWLCAQIGTKTEAELDVLLADKRYAVEVETSMRGMFRQMFSSQKDENIARMRLEVIEALVENMTFAEAFEHTGRYINISIASAERHHRARLLNAISSPNVTLRSACLATSSVPRVVEPTMLEAKNRQGSVVPYLPNARWIDGGFGNDLPMKRLTRLYGVNHFIVSQINIFSTVAPYMRPDPHNGHASIAQQAAQVISSIVRETAKAAQRARWPVSRVIGDSYLDAYNRLFEQEFSGDVTISARFRRQSMGHVMFQYDDGEIEALIDEGRRATWPQVERIRNAIAISRTLDRILARFDAEAVSRSHPLPRRAGLSPS